MKNFSFSTFNVFSILVIIILIVLILLPFNLINMEQAERIAKWKSVYEELKYSFELVNLHEGSIIPTPEEAGKIITDEYIMTRFIPYFNFKDDNIFNPYKHGYRKMNGSPVIKTSQFYFNRFLMRKDGVLIGVKENPKAGLNENQPLYYMFVDINGIKKPNRIGQDIFVINIFKTQIKALGDGKKQRVLKTN